MNFFWDLFLGGLTRGSIYALIALGYTMVYGILQLINFAHGEIYMIGAFTALIVASILTMQGLTGLSVLILATIVAVLYASAYGFTVEKIAYKPLRQASRLSPLISAIGMSIFLQNYVMLAQTSDFLPFPNLLPQSDFLDPYQPRHRPIRFHHYCYLRCHHDRPHPAFKVYQDGQGHAGDGSGSGNGHAHRRECQPGDLPDIYHRFSACSSGRDTDRLTCRQN